MRKLLIPLFVSLALPTAVNAETWYLMAVGRQMARESTSNQWLIPTSSKEECEVAGQEFINRGWGGVFAEKRVEYLCVKGK